MYAIHGSASFSDRGAVSSPLCRDCRVRSVLAVSRAATLRDADSKVAADRARSRRVGRCRL